MNPYRLGATYLGEGCCRFVVWAPLTRKVKVRIVSPRKRVIPLQQRNGGYYQADVQDVEPDSRYLYRLYPEFSQGRHKEFHERPDPASRYQPEGVHGPSQVVTDGFDWRDSAWTGLPLASYILYEVHVGTFTAEGTFDAIIPRLDALKDLGVTALELMPVAQFPGSRNWGYDGTYPFAVQNSYGGPSGLKRLVNACHCKGLAVVLDVVYNHLGPEGNYLRDFAPYFTDCYRIPWGEAVNFDGPDSDEVRHFFIENALYWVGDCHIDALRIDAVHAIVDFSAQPFLEELALEIHKAADRCNRPIYCIAESALNDTRIIRPRALGGFGLDAQWNDDFHHCLHTLLTGEQSGYYRDFGRLRDFAKAWQDGFVYAGQYSAYHRRRHGNSSRNVPARQFVVFSQNHDQVGNRLLGERMSRLVAFDQLKLAAGLVLLSPFIPLLFMGEEYGEIAPFPYFVSHTDSQLTRAVREGRRREFADFGWQQEPPDPQNEATFLRAKLNHAMGDDHRHKGLLSFYRELIRLRKEISALAYLSKKYMEVFRDEHENLLFVRRRSIIDEVCMIFYFGNESRKTMVAIPAGRWQKRLDSAEPRWQGPGSAIPEDLQSTGRANLFLPPHAVVLFWQESSGTLGRAKSPQRRSIMED
jgi:maltooligosyltrehalose trehalohydrolase